MPRRPGWSYVTKGLDLGDGMGLRLILGAMALMGLAACGDDTRDYPSLRPTAEMLAEPAIPGHAADAATDDSLGATLDARGKALEGRAGAERAGGPAITGGGKELQTRADALRARARVLSQQSLDEPECPADQPDCADQSPQE